MYAMLSVGWAARRHAAGLAYADVAYVIECSELDSLLQRARFALFFFWLAILIATRAIARSTTNDRFQIVGKDFRRSAVSQAVPRLLQQS